MKEESVGRIHTPHTSTETNLKEYKAERGEKRRRIDDDPSRAQERHGQEHRAALFRL
jgi:hypothetical protein